MANDPVKPAAAEGDLPRALAFVRAEISAWRRWIRAEELAALDAYYDGLQHDPASGKPPSQSLMLPPPDVCWSCKGPVGRADYCADCGAPANNETVDRLRYLVCVCHEIKKHEREGRLDLSAAHGCLADANSRIAGLRRKLNVERIAAAVAAEAPPPQRPESAPPSPEARPAPPRRNFLEILLDPRSIQWLLASGGGVLVIGLIIWLAALHLFENAMFVAVLLGAANLALLAAGLATVHFTRYQLAGRALTLLACLVMPLNLWFYDAQNILSIAKGEPLWLAALVCVALYAASAAVLRDPMLVYVFVGGVALTGLLLLADHMLMEGALFWEAAAPCTFLAILGLACIYLVRVFPEGEGPFTRGKFGLAFFWSGHAVLAAALLVLLTAQLTCGLFYDAYFRPLYKQLDISLGYSVLIGQSEIVATVWGQLLALGIVAAATCAYVYSDVVVRKVGVYIHLALVTFLWAEILLLNLAFTALPDLTLVDKMEIVIVALALTGLLANLAVTRFEPAGSLLRRTGPALALTLSILPLLLGLVLHVRAIWHYDKLWWWYVAAMAATAVACRAAAFLHQGGKPWLVTLYLFGGGGSLMLAASGVLLSYEPDLPWAYIAPWLMLIPLAFLVAARLYRGRSLETPVVWAAHAMTLVLVVSCLGAVGEGFAVKYDHPENLPLATFFALAAVFYLLAAVWRDREFAVYACAAAAAAAVWQLLSYWNLEPEYYLGAFAVLGLLSLVGYRFAVLEKGQKVGLGRAAFQAGNALLTLAAVGGALLALNSLATSALPPSDQSLVVKRQVELVLLVGLQAVLVAAAAAALFLVRHPAWRRWYILAAVGNAALTVLVLILQIEWTPWQKLEVVCLVLGVALLVAAHLGWFREREREDDMVSFGLLLGSLLVAVPLTWAVLYCRFIGEDFDAFHTLNEVGMLAAGLVLLAAGFAMRVKSTTLVGAAMMALYLVTLPSLIRTGGLWMIGLYLMIGGGLFFGVGLLLAVYRDRLLALPQQIKRREGLFRVLNWR